MRSSISWAARCRQAARSAGDTSFQVFAAASAVFSAASMSAGVASTTWPTTSW